MKRHKYIFVIGGVMSGVGKGITTSSIGTILQSQGHKVNIIKVDPYLNVDAGTMNPTEHGEVFVLNSGLETDQDMGNYERFLNRSLSDADYMTSGMVYKYVIDKERALGFKGKCIDADNIRDEIVHRIINAGVVNGSDISIVEIGGTVGDYQNIMFIEAARVLKIRNPEDVIFIMVSYLPIPNKLGEMKSKPTQNAIRQLSSYGVQADYVIARSEVPLDQKRKEKIAFSCNVAMDHVISAPDIESIYDVPLNFERDKLGEMLSASLKLKSKPVHLEHWKKFVDNVRTAKNLAQKNIERKQEHKNVRIAVVGKYFDTGDFVLSDAYVSVIEALKFSGYELGVAPELIWINAKTFEGDALKSPAKLSALLKKHFSDVDGILVPGGFGETGIEGKLAVIRYAREHKVPYFGLCYGMQLLVIEYARNVLGLHDANTAEINPKAKDVVIDIMEHQKRHLAEGRYGASMRLGAYPCLVKPSTTAEKAYKGSWMVKSKAGENAEAKNGKNTVKNNSKSSGETIISERHRHRYEVNPVYIDQLEKAGLIFSGTSPDGKLMEIAELPQSKQSGKGDTSAKNNGKKNTLGHPFFVGTQFHPEFQARPLAPHPLFTEFIRSAMKFK